MGSLETLERMSSFVWEWLTKQNTSMQQPTAY